MRRALVLLACAGCGAGEFPNSMDLGLDGRLRPLAVVVEPPEAAPGETVQVTMAWLDPDPAQTTVQWRIALEYVTGIYNTTVETDLQDVPGVPAPVCDADGFCAQTVAYTIPDDASRLSPALDYLAAQPTLADAAHAVSPDLTGKLAIDDYLRALAPADATAADLRLADLFQCMLRFRNTIDHGDGSVDVVRTVSVRHSGRLGSPNANTNHTIDGVTLEATPPGGDPISTPVTGPVAITPQDGWTYFLVLDTHAEEYTSPYTPDLHVHEYFEWRTYWYAADDPTSPFDAIRDDAGDPTDLESIDQTIRLQPPAPDEPHHIRVVSVLRDERPEWEQFQSAPGTQLTAVDVDYSDP